MTTLSAPAAGPRRKFAAGLRLAVTRRRCLAAVPRGRRAVAAEREARDLAGMPWRHPEHLTRPLRGRYQKRLAALAAAAWPTDEYKRDLS